MGQQIEQLAQFVANTQWKDLPERVQRQSKLVLMDTVGVILAGSLRPEVQKLRERLTAGAGTGATIYARGCPSHDARTAALLNGIAGRAIELCEGLRLVSGQAGVQTLPGILATAETIDCKGSDVLAALALGYDVAGRLGLAFTPRPLAHQNGQVVMLAAAAAGARVRGMNAEQVSLAMRVATTLVLTPSYSNAVAGATALNVAGGMSSYVGALAPELVLAGFDAQTDAVEEALGQLVGGGFKPDNLLEGLGTRWHITENYFRMYACCNPVHPALDAIKAVTDKLKPRPDEIERIDVATYRFASVMNNSDPPNFFASKYSLPHAAAVLIVKGKAGHNEIDDQAVRDPVISALRRRVHMKEDPAMTAVAPRLRPARVTMTLKDGRTATESRDSHRGDFSEPYEESELRGKFRELAGLVLTQRGVAQVENALDAFEGNNVRRFIETLRNSIAS
ncbi:MAG TPA: MmgE/PrpD family protein [Burkholderiales bacterium]|nr:MmgE/PrpD family protein [Burkholderiales bacterium]